MLRLRWTGTGTLIGIQLTPWGNEIRPVGIYRHENSQYACFFKGYMSSISLSPVARFSEVCSHNRGYLMHRDIGQGLLGCMRTQYADLNSTYFLMH